MKKITNLVFVIIMFIFVTKVQAVERVALSSDKMEVATGEEIVISLNLNNNNKNFVAYTAKIDYDQAVFEIVETENFQGQDNYADITYNKSNNESNEKLLQIKLRVREDANQGKTNITINSITASDGSKDISLEGNTIEIMVVKEGLVENKNLQTYKNQEINKEKNIEIKTKEKSLWALDILVIFMILLIIFIIYYFITSNERNTPDKKRNTIIIISILIVVLIAITIVILIPNKNADVNKDGIINYEDTKEIIEYLLEIKKPEENINLKNKDINNDGKITITDVAISVKQVINQDNISNNQNSNNSDISSNSSEQNLLSNQGEESTQTNSSESILTNLSESNTPTNLSESSTQTSSSESNTQTDENKSNTQANSSKSTTQTNSSKSNTQTNSGKSSNKTSSSNSSTQTDSDKSSTQANPSNPSDQTDTNKTSNSTNSNEQSDSEKEHLYGFTEKNMIITPQISSTSNLILSFENAYKSYYNVEYVVVSGKKYKVTKKGDKYKVEIEKGTKGNNVINIEKVILQNEKEYEINKELKYIYLKDVPTFGNDIGTEIVNSKLKVKLNIQDADSTLKNVTVNLIDENGNNISSKILEIGTKSVELDVHESKNYKIKVIYTYDLGNGNEITEIKTY